MAKEVQKPKKWIETRITMLAKPIFAPGMPNGMKLSAMLKVKAIARSIAVRASFLIGFLFIFLPRYNIAPRGTDNLYINKVIGADDRMIDLTHPMLMDAFLPWATTFDDGDGVMF